MEQSKTLALASMRPHKLPWGMNEDDPACFSLKMGLKARFAGLIELENVQRFLSGMAMGLDMICAELVLELKEPYPDISLTAAVPSKEQDFLWPQTYRDRYARILAQCTEIHIAEEESGSEGIALCKRWMADNCDLLLAVWDGKPGGGAGDIARYAREKHKRIIIVDPFEFAKQSGGKRPNDIVYKFY
jgi:uncharacterized phage-like protein YoqJ